MAGRYHPSAGPPRVTFPRILILLSLLTLSLLLFYTFSSPSLSLQKSPLSNNPEKPNYSFVSSLEHFLSQSHDDVTESNADVAVEKLDLGIWVSENERLNGFYSMNINNYNKVHVYVYEMPRKFTYDLLRLFRDTYRETGNLTSNGSPVHRLIEQHSVDYWLWADLIAPESERLLKNVVRVYRQEEADLFYIPFFTTISFFLLEKQPCKALYRVKP